MSDSGAGIGSLFNIAGGIAAANEQANARAAADARLDDIKNLYNRISMPEIGSEELNLEQLNSGQMLNPQQQQVRQLSMNDQLQNVNLDPRLKQTQMNALETLSKIAGKGFTPDEMNALSQQRSAREADVTAKLKQLQQNQDMRGLGNSEMSLAAQLSAAQSDANRGAQDARDLQAQGFKRSLDAISQGSNLAGSIDNTDYNRQSNLATALRNREGTNLQNQVATEGTNVDRFNRALESNTTRINNTADKNVAIRNDQQQFNKGLIDKNYNRQLDRAATLSGVARNQATNDIAKGNARAGAISGVASGIGSGIMAYNKDNASNGGGNDEMTQFELDNMDSNKLGSTAVPRNRYT